MFYCRCNNQLNEYLGLKVFANAKRHIAEWQARQRALQQYAEERRIPFYRQYQREAIGGETKPTINIYNPNAVPQTDNNVIRAPRRTDIGRPSAITATGARLSNRQQVLNKQLTTYNSRIEVQKESVSMKDLAALTAHNEVEYSLFTKGNKRLIIKGDETHVQITQDMAQSMAKDGWRWSGHTHRGCDNFYDLQASNGDLLILKAFGQKRSVIYNSNGAYQIFEVET